MYPFQFFLSGLFCLLLAYMIFDRKEQKEQHQIPAVLTMDKSAKTLTVQKIYEANWKWDESEICSGTGQLPSGHIQEGDTISHCSGNLAIRHIPSNTLLGAFDFE
jgi:hypothetical protein